jgi:hypothetical protein
MERIIPVDVLEKRMNIPSKIAELSYKDPEKALYYMRIWGEKKLPVTPLYEALVSELN